MNISISSVLSSLIFSTIGLIYFQTGRKRPDLKLLVIGLVMMAYSYFTATPIADWGLGIALSATGYYYWTH